MIVKLTTPEQVALLRKGDIVKKCATNINAKTAPGQKPKVDTYEVRSVNPGRQMIALVMTDDTQDLFSWPGDVNRLFIRSSNLISEKVWWFEQKVAAAARN